MKRTFRFLWLLAGCNLGVAGALAPSVLAQPSVSVQNVDVTEGNAGSADAVLTVTLSAPASGVVTVGYATVNLSIPDSAIGGATCGATNADYVIETGSVQFNAGQTSQTIGIAVCGDVVDEIDERFRVELSNPVGATIGERRARVTIIDNDVAAVAPLPAVSIDDVSVPEGNGGIVVQNGTVRLSATTSQAVTVVVTVAGGTATASTTSCVILPTAPVPGDFVFTPPRPVTIAPGQISAPVPFPICGDTTFEPNETFSVSVVLATPLAATLGDGAGQVTITNDDAAPITISVDDASFPEGNSGGTARIVKARLSAPTTQDVTVDVSVRLGAGVTGGVCTVGRDFNFIPGLKVTVPAGAPDTNISFPICGDTQVEADETFTLVLANPTGGARLGDAEGTVTIQNDDAAAGDTLRADVNMDVFATLATQAAPTLAVVVQARNTGGTAASPLGIRTTLPPNVAFVRLEDNQLGNCSQSSTAANGAAQVNCVMSALAAGSTKTVRIVGNVVGNIADSTQVVFTTEGDPSNSVPESDEADNVDSFTMTVRAISDVLVSSVDLDTLNIERPIIKELTPGSTFTFHYQWTVRNAGPFPSPATTLLIEWPTNAGVQVFGGDGNDIPLTEVVAIPALASGATTAIPRTVKLRISTNSPTPATARATVDPNHRIFDPIVSNNVSTLTVSLSN